MAVRPINSNRIARICFSRQVLLKTGGIPVELISGIMSRLPNGTKLIGFRDENLVSEMHFESKNFKELKEGSMVPEIIVHIVEDAVGDVIIQDVDMSQTLDIPPMSGTVTGRFSSGIPFIKCEININDIKVAGGCDCGTKMNSHHINCPAHPANETVS